MTIELINEKTRLPQEGRHLELGSADVRRSETLMCMDIHSFGKTADFPCGLNNDIWSMRRFGGVYMRNPGAIAPVQLYNMYNILIFFYFLYIYFWHVYTLHPQVNMELLRYILIH